MTDVTQPPRRMRFSFESRCRLVALVLAGESPSSAAAALGVFAVLRRRPAQAPAEVVEIAVEEALEEAA